MSSIGILDSMYGSLYSSYPGLSDSIYGRRPAYSTSSPYSPYTSTYSSSYGRYTSSPHSSMSSYDKYSSSYLDDFSSVKKDRYSSGYGSSNRLPASSSTPSLSATYRPRFLMNSDLISIDQAAVKSNEELRRLDSRPSTSTMIKSVPITDKLGNELSNYERWKMQRDGGAERSLMNASSSASAASSSAVEEKPKRRSRLHVHFEDTGESNNRDDSSDARTPSIRAREMSAMPASRISGEESSLFSSSHGSRASSLVPSMSSFKSSHGSKRTQRAFPLRVAEKLAGYDVQDVTGDGGCYYRCLSLFFTGSEHSYMKYRREVMEYIRSNLDNYSTMIRSELTVGRSTNDYFSRKMRADRQDWAETTEIIATCCVYNINVHVLALVPGRRASWEWLHFDPSIGTGKTGARATRDIYLYNAGSVHFMLCTPR